MKIESFRDLDRLLRLCRKHGVQDISVDGVTLKLLDAPPTPKRARSAVETTTDLIDTPDQLTPEQLLFGSSDPAVWASSQETIENLEKIRLGQ